MPPQNTTITGKSKGRSHVCRFTKDCLLESTSLAVKIFHAPNYQCQPLPSAFQVLGKFQATRAVGKIMVHGVDGAGERRKPQTVSGNHCDQNKCAESAFWVKAPGPR